MVQIKRMKKISISALLFMLVTSFQTAVVDKKEFEGIITYAIVVESKTSVIPTAKFQQLFGDTMKLSIKKGNYRMTYNGRDIKDIYYLTSRNKEYDRRNGIDTLFVTACEIENRVLIRSAAQPTNEKIMNRTCEKLINDFGNTTNSYWYDPTIYLNPTPFEKLKFSFLNIYYEKAKSPWLKCKYEGKSFSLTYTAIAIKECVLNDNIFQLPNLPERKL